jgi:hypothetical protein
MRVMGWATRLRNAYATSRIHGRGDDNIRSGAVDDCS